MPFWHPCLIENPRGGRLSKRSWPGPPCCRQWLLCYCSPASANVFLLACSFHSCLLPLFTAWQQNASTGLFPGRGVTGTAAVMEHLLLRSSGQNCLNQGGNLLGAFHPAMLFLAVAHSMARLDRKATPSLSVRCCSGVDAPSSALLSQLMHMSVVAPVRLHFQMAGNTLCITYLLPRRSRQIAPGLGGKEWHTHQVETKSMFRLQCFAMEHSG